MSNNRILQILFSGSGTVAVLFLAITWAYWTTFGNFAERWSSDAQYSHGYLVPIFALGLLYARRKELAPLQWRPSLWALGLLGVATAMRLAGAHFYFTWIEQISILPAIAGVVLAA